MAPLQSVAALRWTKIGKYLALDHDVEVDVLTTYKDFSDPAGRYRRDDTLLADMEHFGTFHLLRPPVAVRAFAGARSWMARLLRAREDDGPVQAAVTYKGAFEDLKSFGRRVDLALGRLLAARGSAMDLSSYDVIVSTCGPGWPHLVARAEKRRRPDVVWLADFRDPVSRNPADRRLCKAYGEVVASADAALAVSEGLVPLIFARPGQPVHVLTNGFDPADRPRRPEGARRPLDRFRVSYTGTLYHLPWETENIATVLRLLQAMVDDGEADGDHLEFVYAGASSAVFRCQAATVEGVSFPVRDLGLLPRHEVLDLQQASALLAFSTWNTSAQQGVITGKLWEYLMAGVPVLGACTGELSGSEARRVVESARAGVVMEAPAAAADAVRARRFVAGLYRQWLEEGTTSVDGDAAYVDSHSYPALAARLMDEVILPLTGSRSRS